MNFRDLMDPRSKVRFDFLSNPDLIERVAYAAGLCQPSEITVLDDSIDSSSYARRRAIELGEELPTEKKDQTVHFDNIQDVARAPKQTFVVTDEKLGDKINTLPVEEGVRQARELMTATMKGREMFIGFHHFCPSGGPHAVPMVQITDSPTAFNHQSVLTFPAYQGFKELYTNAGRFITILHSTGELRKMEHGGSVSTDVNKRRVFKFVDRDMVVAGPTQYAGNSLLKKNGFSLEIHRSLNDGRLTEHMFLMKLGSFPSPIYLAGAFPSGCGKTTTSMVSTTRSPHSIVNDDLVSIRAIGDEAMAAGLENGMFGIIKGINEKTDPVLWKVLNSDGRIVFSNVLMSNGKIYWEGMGQSPDRGFNTNGLWTPDGGIISDKNARFAIPLNTLPNLDREGLNSPNGVPLSAIVYGGRDPTLGVMPPVVATFHGREGWNYGVSLFGFGLESKPTATVLNPGTELEINPLANIDFLTTSLRKYAQGHYGLAAKLTDVPLIFGFNYFQQGIDGKRLTGIADTEVLLHWVHGNVIGKYRGVETPIGIIPRFDDLRTIYQNLLNRGFTEQEYGLQYGLDRDKWLEKLGRIDKYYVDESMPRTFGNQLGALRARLNHMQSGFTSPFSFKAK